MKVGILGNVNKVKNVETVESIANYLRESGYETVRFNAHAEIDGVDVVVVLGGDGAILHAALVAAKKNIKIVGINYGTLGFLTEYEKAEWESVKDLLSSLDKGVCPIVKRSLLELTIGDKTYHALNEIAIQRDYGLISTNSTQILKVEVETKEGRDAIAGDGLLFCTPTGSTAYALSAGGPIMEPELSCIEIALICPHSLFNRPLLLSSERKISIRHTANCERTIFLSADGEPPVAFPPNYRLDIERSKYEISLVQFRNNGFYDAVNHKLTQSIKGFPEHLSTEERT